MRIRPSHASGPTQAPPRRTALQKHIDFFDGNGDGEIRVWETYGGCRKLGMGRIFSAAAAVAINAGLGVKSGSPWHKWLTIQTDGIHKTKHEGDTGAFDQDGEKVQARIDGMLVHDKDGDDALNKQELHEMMCTNGGGKPSLGSRLEFGLLLRLAGEESPNGRVLTRTKLQGFYDGSLFYHMAGEPVPWEMKKAPVAGALSS